MIVEGYYSHTLLSFFPVKVAMKADSIGKANLTGGGLTGKYMFAQMHFNWGDDAHGSGHTLKGHRYPLEVP